MTDEDRIFTGTLVVRGSMQWPAEANDVDVFVMCAPSYMDDVKAGKDPACWSNHLEYVKANLRELGCPLEWIVFFATPHQDTSTMHYILRVVFAELSLETVKSSVLEALKLNVRNGDDHYNGHMRIGTPDFRIVKDMTLQNAFSTLAANRLLQFQLATLCNVHCSGSTEAEFLQSKQRQHPTLYEYFETGLLSSRVFIETQDPPKTIEEAHEDMKHATVNRQMFMLQQERKGREMRGGGALDEEDQETLRQLDAAVAKATRTHARMVRQAKADKAAKEAAHVVPPKKHVVKLPSFKKPAQ